MKLQKTPLILLLVALALGSAVVIYESQIVSRQEEAKAKSEQLFSFKEDDVQAFSVTTSAQTVSFAKTPAGQVANPPKTNAKAPAKEEPQIWMMTVPQKTYADPAAVAYLLSLMSTSKRVDTLTVPAGRRAEFGFDKPMAIAEVKLTNQQTQQLLLGKPNFDRSAIYAQVNPPTDPKQDLAIVLVSTDFENAVNRPLAEWQMKEKKPAQKSDQIKKAQ